MAYNSEQSVYDVVVNMLGIEGQIRGDEYSFSCISGSHPDHKPSCGINLNTGLFHCFSCGASGTLVQLVALKQECSIFTAEEMLKPRSVSAALSVLKRAANLATSTLARQPKALPGPYKRKPLEYLLNRGFTKETLKLYGVRYVPEENLISSKGTYFKIREYIAIPVRDYNQYLMSWIYRATRPIEPRYIYTTGVQLNQLWFGTNIFPSSRLVVVTEGALDSMWVAQAGIPAIAALGATNIGNSKVAMLNRYGSVVLLGDRDAAGIAMVKQLGSLIAHKIPTRVARYPVPAKDPCELSAEQVWDSVYNAVPFTAWSGYTR